MILFVRLLADMVMIINKTKIVPVQKVLAQKSTMFKLKLFTSGDSGRFLHSNYFSQSAVKI